MTLLTPAVIEVFLCDPSGVRIESLDYLTAYAYNRRVNGITPCNIILPAKFDRSHIKLDNIIEVWRGVGPGTLRMDYCGFLRGWKYTVDESGSEATELKFVSVNYLLDGRIVDTYAGSTAGKMTDYADDMIKAVAINELGASASADRSLTSVGGGFTIQGDLGDGVSVTKYFANKNVYNTFLDIAASSAQAGTKVYFQVVPITTSDSTGQIAFELRTYTGQLGMDRTSSSDAPVFIGTAWGNLSNGSWEADFSDERNVVKVLGQGEGADRETTTVTDTARSEMSIWNRREGAKDARNIALGDTNGRTAEGYTYLDENKPRYKLSGDVVETPNFRYGRDWFLGDRVTVDFCGIQGDAMIDNVTISKDPGGQESISAKLVLDELV